MIIQTRLKLGKFSRSVNYSKMLSTEVRQSLADRMVCLHNRTKSNLAFTHMSTNLSPSSDGRDDELLNEQILRLATALFPDEKIISLVPLKEAILVGKFEVGLQNLKAKYKLSDKTEETLRGLVEQHVKFALETPRGNMAFSEAKSLLRPQIMPISYPMRRTMISRPFSEDLATGLVINFEKTYGYVTPDHVSRWAVSSEELFSTAIVNLEEASRGMQMHFSDNGDTKYIASEKKDGFDAVRILLPRLREFIASRLGVPFVFAIPNRDFLICWNLTAPPQFFDFAKSKVENDNSSQPYPLSPNCFKMDIDGSITLRKW